MTQGLGFYPGHSSTHVGHLLVKCSCNTVKTRYIGVRRLKSTRIQFYILGGCSQMHRTQCGALTSQERSPRAATHKGFPAEHPPAFDPFTTPAFLADLRAVLDESEGDRAEGDTVAAAGPPWGS